MRSFTFKSKISKQQEIMKKVAKITIGIIVAYILFCLFVYWFNKDNVWHDPKPGGAETFARIFAPFHTLQMAKQG